MPDLVGVKFKKSGKLLFFLKNDIELTYGDRCVVETERGEDLATVVIASRSVQKMDDREKNRRIVRIATQEDIDARNELDALEKEALSFCRNRITERELDMKLVSADFTLDRAKAIFYFTADGRIDFRELVKDLAHRFHLRIEMRQIGVRDEAKMLGGIAVCGQPLCCSQFLTRFDPVSIKMAKAQSLILNPSKISGTCGRLMCCINYEICRDNDKNCHKNGKGHCKKIEKDATSDTENS